MTRFSAYTVVFPKYQKTAKQKLISSHSLISKTEEGFINRSSVKKVVLYRKTKILIKVQIGISNEFFIPKLKFTESKSCIAGVAWYSRELLLHRSQCNM